MNVNTFIGAYRNHPILFIGTGVSLRYLTQSYTWDALLKKIALELSDTNEYYLDVKSQSQVGDSFRYDLIAARLEKDFTEALMKDRYGKFKHVNDKFYELMDKGINVSRLKIYISMLVESTETKPEMASELAELKKIGKNIGSIITTNYDKFIESFLDFIPLIGNDILLSNPYGAVYKIHGCISDPRRIIITDSDYVRFEGNYELIRAQLLSLFIHNPIIFIGYSVGDDNIKSLLKTVFTYVESNSDLAKRIKDNFLLVEYEPGSDNQEITDHDIDIQGFPTIRINKIKTNDFTAIYQTISNLSLPISAMDIRKVQSIVKEIYAGGDIKVKITEDLDSLKNEDKILAIGSKKSIQYQYMTAKETANNYFKIVEESNSQLLELIDKYQISANQYFPIFAFNSICPNIHRAKELKEQQTRKLQEAIDQVAEACKTKHKLIKYITEDSLISATNKCKAVLWSIMNNKVSLEDTEAFLKNFPYPNKTEYRKILCAYDLKKYQASEL
jgi:hypothetical protein